MKVCANQRVHELREHMRGGDGAAVLDTVPAAMLPAHTRLAGVITLKKGCSIGSHAHEGETEIFLFHAGIGRVEDNGEDKPVGPGDVVITGGGATHAVANTGEADLVFTAVIVTEA